MKKVSAFAIIFLLLFIIVPLSLAGDEDTTLADSSEAQIEKGFDCLEAKAQSCSGLTTQEVALTILATPDNIFDSCVEELENRSTFNHWDNIKDTAIAILALNHAGKDTTASENWLITQNKTPSELVWYLQQDSNEEVTCMISYDSKSYDNIIIGADKKIDSSAGRCLTLTSSKFWFEVWSKCYDEKFTIKCNKEFIANLLYKNKNSPTLYVLEGTKTYGKGSMSDDIQIKSKCFGSKSCNYEATAWATTALLKTGHNIDEFVPYLIAMSDSNERYLPEAFIYMLTNYEDYATQLIANQDQLGSYWDADSSTSTKYYDTALALIAMESSSATQITNAREQLLFDQDENGCWKTVKDTAIVLWALDNRAGRISINGQSSTIPYCSSSGYFCIPKSDCPSSDDFGGTYSCGLSTLNTCCKTENLKTCSEYKGEKCSSGETCKSTSKKSSDISECCLGGCEEASEKSEKSECEENYYDCMSSCSDRQEPMSDYSCKGSEVCCRTKTKDPNEESLWWVWILVVLILIVLVGIGYIYRAKLKEILSKLKKKPKKSKGRRGTNPIRPGPGMPPRPGFPPVRRPMPPVAPMRQRPSHQDKAMSDTFSKLKEMSS